MLLAIDPGLAGTGWALWTEQPGSSIHTPPLVARVIPATATDAWWVRALAIAEKIEFAMDLYGMDEPESSMVVCEFPEYQESAGRQMGWRRGDLQKLTFLVGAIADRVYPIPFYPVKPSAWKGQLPKTIVEERIRRRYGDDVCALLGIKSHAWDAVGIGIWALEKKQGKAQWPKFQE